MDGGIVIGQLILACGVIIINLSHWWEYFSNIFGYNIGLVDMVGALGKIKAQKREKW